MFKRLLAFALACCLVFDAAPVTSYAAGIQEETVLTETEESVPVETEEAVPKETEESVPAESGTEESNSSETAGENIPTETAEDVSAENEKNPEAEGISGVIETQEYADPADEQSVSDGNPTVEDGRLPLTKNEEDGSYSFETEDYRVNVRPEAGSLFLRFNISLEAKGQMPASAYTFPFVVYYKKSGSDATPAEGNVSLSYALNYKSTNYFVAIDSGEAYDVYFALKDYTSGSGILGTTEEISLQTEQTDKAVVIHGVTETETDITFDLEANASMYLYYAPADGSGEEQRVYVLRGWNDFTLPGLQPDTEYNVQFANLNSPTVLLETKVATAAAFTQVDWQIDAAADEFGLSVKADVSKYTGTSSYAIVHFVYTNALGEEQEAYTNLSLVGSNVTEAEDGTKSFSISSTVAEGLLADTEYEVTVWLQIGSVIYGKTTRKVTTPQAAYAADDIEFTVEQSATSAKTIECKVTNKNAADGDSPMKAFLYYRREGDEEAYQKGSSSNSSGSLATFYLSQLEYGATYHYVVLVGGVMKELTETFGAPEVKLTAVGEGEVNAFDFVRTWKAESTEGAEALSGNYYLNLYYLDGSTYQRLGSAVVLSAENDYQAEIKTAAFKWLNPDTDYKLKWILGTTATAGVYDAALYTFYETVHTGKADITIEDAGDTAYDTRQYKVSLSQTDTVNFAESSYALYLYNYIRKAGSGSFRLISSVALSNGNSFSSSISLNNLEAGTDYEVSLRSNGNGYSASQEYAVWTFTTPKDERAINVTGVSAKLHTATLNYTLTGILPAANYGYISCFIREKSEGSEWERVSYDHYYTGTTGHTGSYNIQTCQGKELKDNTTYEYQIGFGKYNAALSELDKTVAGEFATAEDTRSLSGAGVSAGYTTARAGATFSGNDYNAASYIYLFYREKGTDSWTKTTYQYTNQTTADYTRTFDGLNPGTEYEYVIVIANNSACDSPDAVTEDRRRAAGEFTTKQAAYTLSFAVDESKTTHNKAVVAVSAKDSTEDDRVEVALELNNGLSNTTTLKRSTGYTQNVTFSDLLGGTEYTVTKAVLSVTEEDRIVKIAELSCDYKFTTRAAEIPTSISLSQEKISLNVADTKGNFYEGYNQKTLKATAEPGTAAADFVWESSNPEVAVVRNGVVYAVGVGEAEITVSSAYDETVKASCDVTVKRYVIGYVAQTGAAPDAWYYYSSGSVYKGGYVDGLGLYEQDETGALTLLPDFEVTADRSGIVSWDSALNRLQTLSVGTVRLWMEKDGVKACFSLTVTAAGKGFAVTGFVTNSNYPAVEGAEADSYILACTPGVIYRATGEISPAQDFDPYEFTWEISDENVATVSEAGVITPVKAGDVTLTVTPKLFRTLQNRPYIQDKAVITLQIRELPDLGSESVFALANTKGKIGDVPFPETWGEGWSWKYPNTPLVTNGVYTDNKYEFEAVYSDTKSGADGRYPCEKTLSVYIGRITGVSVSEIADEHNHVLEVSDAGAVGVSADTISLAVSPIWQGKSSADAYVVEIPEVKGLTIAKNAETGYYDITAGKTGNFTLNIAIRAKDTNAVLAKTTYNIKATAEKQAAAIILQLDESSKANGISMNAAGNIIFTAVDDKKDFTLNAIVRDRNGQELDTVLQWKTTDKTVAAVTTAKKDTHTASVTVKGEGHTVLTATAKDASGYTVTLNLEVQNHKPRVSAAKATVNIAYDYESSNGRTLAAAAGSVEIVPVYGESIKTVKLCDENGQPRTDMQADRYSYGSGSEQYLIIPATAEIPTGTFNCKLLVTTSADVEYSYDLKVSVVDKAPSVSAKMASAVNLFFTDSAGRIDLKISGDNQVESGSVVWEDQSEGVNNGFAMNAYSYLQNNKYVSYIIVGQQTNLRLDKGKLQDTGVEKGTLRVKVRGYRKIYTFENFKIKYTYKKPSLVTSSASSNVAPTVGQNAGRFYIYDKTNKRILYFANESYSSSYYDELTWDNEEAVALKVSGAYATYNYAGETGIKKLTLTLDSIYWREPLKATHTIKVIKPQAYLVSSQLTYNTALRSTASVTIGLKNTTYAISYADIVIEGANSASKKLIEDDLFLITASNNRITVEQSDAKLMGASIPAGSYSYKVTPYYENPETGDRTALNTMTLKVKVVNKPVTAKVSPKGTLNLTYGAYATPIDKKNIAVLVDPKFANLGSGYFLYDYRLIGEYSDYFQLNYANIRYAGKSAYHYYITLNDGSTRKLKAGQTYKLAIEYTIRNTAGETFTVTSNTFSIKPKQTTAKVTVKNNNQTLYAGSTMNRSYQLSVPAYYAISSASGSIDCNKDGKADITVSGTSILTVRIVDADAVGASASGKTYSIPVTVCLRGRDGVSKDVKTTIKVKVKR